MLVYTQTAELMAYLEAQRHSGAKIGFVPTMGALHDGHISLVKEAKRSNSFVIVSIFVNPTQFNNPEDLKNYPKTPESDLAMLEAAGVDLLFLPEVTEIYTHGLSEGKSVDLGDLERVMEGAHRPGHFKGVVQVVARLFDIVQPDQAYFGEKDFQQLAVIRKMTHDLKYKIKIIGCETKREENGLAMSSRNLRLTAEERETAATIYKTLQFVKANWRTKGETAVLKEAIEMINSKPPLKVEYLEIADATTLQPIQDNTKENARVFAAVFCGKVRLIDNISI